MGVDVAAEAGLRVVNVACHTVPCHLQLKFAEFFFFSPLNWRDLLHFHIMSRVMLLQRDFIFLFGRGGVDGLVQDCCRSANGFCAAAVCRRISDKGKERVYF